MQRGIARFISFSLLSTFLALISPQIAHAAACSVSLFTSGSYKYIRVISASGCTWTIPTGVTTVDYVVVGGGGGGGGGNTGGTLGGGGGGAAGIVQTGTGLSVTPGGSLTMTIGTGGAGGAVITSGTNGSQSQLVVSGGSTITAGGGNGGQRAGTGGSQNDLSGDGGANTSFAGGANVWDGGGGGAGAAAIGTDGQDIGGQGGTGGPGGSGVTSALVNDLSTATSSGQNVGGNYYFGGGGGGGSTPAGSGNPPAGANTGVGAVGGNGGGGTGGFSTSGVGATSAATNTGGGGGGGGWKSDAADAARGGGAGADGIIIIRFSKSTTSITALSFTSNGGSDNTYAVGDVITFSTTWSDSVTITGAPRFPINGLSSKYLSYYSGSGSPTIIFNYSVVSGDTSSAGISIIANTLALNSGTILDSAGFSASLTHAAITAASNQKVDGIVPTITSSASFSLPENTTAVGTITSSKSVTFAITSGSDSSFFTLDTNTGVLTISARNFEAPADSNADNIYVVIVRATDPYGNQSTTQTIQVTISNVAEQANVLSSSYTGASKYRTNFIITLTVDTPGKVVFYSKGKRIPGCVSISTSGSSSPYSAVCTFRPSINGAAQFSARINPSDGSTTPTTTVLPPVVIDRRAGNR